jgi:hypothetical protein
MTYGSDKTVLRSIRITEQISKIVQSDAKNKGLTVNALISAILTKYVEWDRFAERYGFISITRNGFRRIQEALGEGNLVKVAEELGALNPKEMVSFWFKEINVDTFLGWLSTYCRYGRIAEYELETNGRNYTVTLRHELGSEYSRFLGYYIVQAIRTVLGTDSRLDVSTNSVTVKFTALRS